jgi:cell shape-determining protein MreD
MRWHLYLPLLFATSAAALTLHAAVGPAAPNLLLLAAFYAALASPLAHQSLIWWLAGLGYDLSVGGRPGAGALLFLLLGLVVVGWQHRFRSGHGAAQIVLTTLLALAAGLLAPVLAYGPQAVLAFDAEHLRLVVAGAALTGALALPWRHTLGRLRPGKTADSGARLRAAG